ncbi:MAG: hypothetical protein ACI4HI_18230 [Lachnospiraceae bacterium]
MMPGLTNKDTKYESGKKNNFTLEQIAIATGKSEEEIKEIIEKNESVLA